MLVHLDDTTQDPPVIVKMSVPVSVTEHDERGAIRPALIGVVKETAEKGVNAQDIEVVPGCLYAPGSDRAFTAIERYLRDAVRRKILEATISSAQIYIVGIGRARVFAAVGLNGIEALCPRGLERPQDHAIHHAEHNGVGTYRHRQCEDRREGEPGRFA